LGGKEADLHHARSQLSLSSFPRLTEKIDATKKDPQAMSFLLLFLLFVFSLLRNIFFVFFLFLAPPLQLLVLFPSVPPPSFSTGEVQEERKKLLGVLFKAQATGTDQ